MGLISRVSSRTYRDHGHVVQKCFASQPPATKCPKHGRRSHQGFQRLLETGHLHWCTPRRSRNRRLRLPTRTSTLGPPRPTRMERIPMVEHPKQELRLGRRKTLSLPHHWLNGIVGKGYDGPAH